MSFFISSNAFSNESSPIKYELRTSGEGLATLSEMVPAGLDYMWLINLLMSIAMLVAVGTTIWSGIDYFIKSKDVVLKSK